MKKTNTILTAIVMLVMVITMAQPIETFAASAKPVIKATQTVISKGKKTSLKASYNGKNVTKKATWKSSNKKVATVNKGVVTGKKVGTTYVSVIYKGVTSKKVKITVAEMKLNKTNLKLTIGKKTSLKVTYNGKNVTKKATWKSSNTNVATVSKSGVVTGKKAGTTYITATYKGNKIRCRVRVTEKPHTHDFQPVYKTIHHKEEGHYEEQQVMVQPEWTEEIKDGAYICNTCGMQFVYGEYESPDDALDAIGVHPIESPGCGGYHSEEVVVDTIHHEAEYETQQVWIVDTEAHDETVIDHYECSCGATK